MEPTDEGGRLRSAGGVRCQTEVDTDGRYSWRIVAQNGRMVAESATAYGSYEQCRDAFDALCRQHDVLAGGVQHTAEANGWMWVVRDKDERRAIVSARSYQRYSTCRAAYNRFRELLRQLSDDGEMSWDGG